MLSDASRSSPNGHIYEYLDYYVNLSHSPKFSVLLTGPWGIGKTYLIGSFIKSAKDKGKRGIHVSLFGMTSREEIDSALLCA